MPDPGVSSGAVLPDPGVSSGAALSDPGLKVEPLDTSWGVVLDKSMVELDDINMLCDIGACMDTSEEQASTSPSKADHTADLNGYTESNVSVPAGIGVSSLGGLQVICMDSGTAEADSQRTNDTERDPKTHTSRRRARTQHEQI